MMDGDRFAASNLESLRAHFAGCRRVVLVLDALHPDDRDRMAERLSRAFRHLADIESEPLHRRPGSEARAALRATDGIFVAGGQTFHLLRELHRTGQLEVLRERIDAGVPYLGSSAGANIAGPKIGTTNDFPVADVPSILSLDVFPAVINPHHPAVAGSPDDATRAFRIRDYLRFNPGRRVLALGDRALVSLRRGQVRVEVGPVWLYEEGTRTHLGDGERIGALSGLAAARPPRLGDPGWVPDERRMDPRFPAMQEWARAGVRGGVPLRDSLPVVSRAAPGDDLQAAVDRAAAAGGGVVLLGAGDHPLRATLRLASGVVLRGEDPERAILHVKMKAPFFRTSGQPQAVAILGKSVRRAGLEDLTVRYSAVDFEPLDGGDFDAPWDRRIFHGPEERDTGLHVHLVIFRESEDSWVDNCRLLWAGQHPIGLGACRHMTLRDNVVDRAYIKQDSMHGGYYGVWGTSHSLFINERVSRIRHFALMLPGCRYNVVLGCDLETDLNFHDADDGENLIESSWIRTPVWHSWDAVARGAPGRHRPPGAGNLLLNVGAVSKGVPGFSRKGPLPEPGVVYEVAATFDGPAVFARPGPAPAGGTLYAVRREDSPN